MSVQTIKKEAEVEFYAPETIREIQSKKLVESVKYAYENSEFYRQYYDSVGFNPMDIKTVDDITKIPFVNRKMLGEHNNAVTAVPRSKIIDINATSGTTGKPLYVPMTARDLDLFSRLCARGMVYWGIDENDAAHMMLSSDNLIVASKILGTSLETHLGSLCIRVGPVGAERHITVMKDLKPNVFVGIAPYFLSLGRRLEEIGFHPKKELEIKVLFSTASPTYHSRWTPLATTREFTQIWGAPVCSILGTTESCVGFFECPASNGHHVHWDYIIAEIIDPKSGEQLPSGTPGELVVTFCGREAFPFIRYRTSDITMIETDPCPCGRNNPRIMAITGRIDEMIQIKGRLLFPIQIEEAVMSVPGIVNHLTELVTDEYGMDQIVLTVGIRGGDNDTTEEDIVQRVRQSVKSATHVTPKIKVDKPENVERVWFLEQRRVPRKFWDRRSKQ